MNRISILSFFLFFIVNQQLTAQSPNFQHTSGNFSYINPAFSGMSNYSLLHLDYLTQNNRKGDDWLSIAGVLDTYMSRIKSSIGIKFLSDNYSGSGNDVFNMNLMYAYHLRLSRRWHLTSGIELGFIQNKLNGGFVNRYNYEPFLFQNGSDKEEKKAFDVGAGVLLYSRKYYFGLSANHINKPIEAQFDNENSKLPTKYSAIVGKVFPLRAKGKRMREVTQAIYTTFIHQYQDSRYFIDSINASLIDPVNISTLMVSYQKKPFLIGVSYKHIYNEAPIYGGRVAFNLGDFNLSYGYSYSPTSSNPTHFSQLSIGYIFNRNMQYRRSSGRYGLPSPGFSAVISNRSRYYSHTYSSSEAELSKGNILADTIEMNTEEYDRIYENPFLDVVENPLSTFSIDVDNASYSNMRRFIENDQLPPADAVRIEEFINYFDYDYPESVDEHPISIITEINKCPWNKDHELLSIGLKGKTDSTQINKPNNLVFLIDVSGSMEAPNKLGLVKKSLNILLDQLSPNDKVAIVVYAGNSGLVLPSTSITQKGNIIEALDRLSAGGSTAGGEGIVLAYKEAKKNLIEDGNNRVILLTDGDFNVGISSTGDLVRMIEEKRKDDVFLTICGFGMGNYKDGRMEQISNAGNGNYFYIDGIKEAGKVFANDLLSNLYITAKDVKLQLEFNPKYIKSYRLIGYENRVLKKEDFNDDKKDAGELGPGSSVTALYEIIPADVKNDSLQPAKVDELRYQKIVTKKTLIKKKELLTLKLRYKLPKDTTSLLMTKYLKEKVIEDSTASNSFNFAAAVAQYGLLLRDSKYKGTANYSSVLNLAKQSAGNDKYEFKKEFIKLVEKAMILDKKKKIQKNSDEQK